MTFDRYVLAFFEHLFKRPFQVDDWVHEGRRDLDILFCNFHVVWCLLESMFETISAFAGSNVTMPYAEIGASLSTIAVLVYCCGGVVFVVVRIWLYSKYCEQMIIDFHQLSHYYNILQLVHTKYKLRKPKQRLRKISLLDIFLNNNNKLYVKGDQAHTCNLQPWITIFSGLCFILRIALCRHIYITWHILHVLCINKYIIL